MNIRYKGLRTISQILEEILTNYKGKRMEK